MEPIPVDQFELVTYEQLHDVKEGTLVGLKTKRCTCFYADSLYEYQGLIMHPNGKRAYPCMIALSDFDYGSQELIWSSRMYIDGAKLTDLNRNGIEIYIEKPQNSVRFITE